MRLHTCTTWLWSVRPVRLDCRRSDCRRGARGSITSATASCSGAGTGTPSRWAPAGSMAARTRAEICAFTHKSRRAGGAWPTMRSRARPTLTQLIRSLDCPSQCPSLTLSARCRVCKPPSGKGGSDLRSNLGSSPPTHQSKSVKARIKLWPKKELTQCFDHAAQRCSGV